MIKKYFQTEFYDEFLLSSCLYIPKRTFYVHDLSQIIKMYLDVSSALLCAHPLYPIPFRKVSSNVALKNLKSEYNLIVFSIKSISSNLFVQCISLPDLMILWEKRIGASFIITKSTSSVFKTSSNLPIRSRCLSNRICLSSSPEIRVPKS